MQVSEAELATKNDLDKLEIRLTGELNLVKWMLGAILALAIANFVKENRRVLAIARLR